MKMFLLVLSMIFILISLVSAVTGLSINENKNPVIYISSDKLISDNVDKELLNKIKNAISGSANVIIDEKSPNPGEAPRAIQNAPGGIAVFIAASDPGSMNEIVYGIKKGYLNKDAQKLDGIVFVNYGGVNLENISYLPRAYDDNYSSPYFAGLYNPAAFLKSSGIVLIQPNIGTSSDGARINKIATGLLEAAHSPNKDHLNPSYNSELVAIHQINPEKVAYGSQSIIAGKNPDMGYSKWMYLASQYVSGYPIKNSDQKFSGSYDGENSTYFGVLTTDEYREVGKAVSEYIEANKTVPQSIKVEGRTLKKADLQYLFAGLTYDHTSSQNMIFPRYIFINRSLEPFDIIVKYIRSSFNQIFIF